MDSLNLATIESSAVQKPQASAKYFLPARDASSLELTIPTEEPVFNELSQASSFQARPPLCGGSFQSDLILLSRGIQRFSSLKTAIGTHESGL